MPFDQNLKRKTVVRVVPENTNLVRIYMKGAPEYVIPCCDKTIDKDNQPNLVELSADTKQQLLEDTIG